MSKEADEKIFVNVCVLDESKEQFYCSEIALLLLRRLKVCFV